MSTKTTDRQCYLCGELESTHSKRPADWRSVPGCTGAYMMPPAVDGGPSPTTPDRDSQADTASLRARLEALRDAWRLESGGDNDDAYDPAAAYNRGMDRCADDLDTLLSEAPHAAQEPG